MSILAFLPKKFYFFQEPSLYTLYKRGPPSQKGALTFISALLSIY